MTTTLGLCLATNRCTICAATGPCESVHLRRRHREGLCWDCARWLIKRRDGLTVTVGLRRAERQAREELARAKRALDAEDFRSFRDGGTR